MAAGSALFGVFVLLLMLVVPLIVGIALIVTSRRGGLGYPACGACKYNLSATVGTADRCPECGSPFTQVGILPPRGKGRPVLLWIGVAVLLFPLMILGLSMGAFVYRSAAAKSAQQQAIIVQQQAGAAQQAQLQADSSQDTTPDAPADAATPKSGGESE